MTKASEHDLNLFDAHGNSLCGPFSIQAAFFGKLKHTVKKITFRKWKKNVDLGDLSLEITLDILNTGSSTAPKWTTTTL